MNEYEKKLEEYRAREKRTRMLQRFKDIVRKPIDYSSSGLSTLKNKVQERLSLSSTSAIQYERVALDDTEVAAEPEIRKTHLLPNDSVETDDLPLDINWKKLLLCIIIWITLFCYAVYIQFGAVFIIFSGFYIIWTNTRTRPKYENEISAYSVFNPNCEAIDGTINAKQLQKEMLLGGFH